MDFFDSVRVLLRRWYVVLLGVVLTGGAAFYAITVVPTSYQARAQYVLLLPAGSPGPDAINPYLNLNGGLTFAASLIASEIGTQAAAREMVEAGYTSKYTVGQSSGVGPLLEVNVSGTDKENVLATRDAVLIRFDKELFKLQEIPGIPSRQQIFSRTNAVDPKAEAVPGAKKKALLLIAALGATLTLVAAFTIDGLLRRRGSNRTAATAPDDEVDRADPVDPDAVVVTKLGKVDSEHVHRHRDAVSATASARPTPQKKSPAPSARGLSSVSPPGRQHSPSVRRGGRG